MKLTFVFLVVGGIIFHLKFGEPKPSLMSQAIQQVIEQHYVKNSVRFEIVYNSNSLELVRETLKLIKELKDYRISKVNDDDKTNFDIQRSMIFIFDSFEKFKKLESRFNFDLDHVPMDLNLLIYCEKWEDEIIPPPHEYQLYSYLVENENEIILKTLSLFTPQHCRPLRLVDMNKFSRKSSKWTGETFFMTTVRDFHGCELYFGLQTNAPTSLAKAKLLANGTYDVYGIAVDLYDSLAPHLNYKVVKVVYDDKIRPNKVDQYYNSFCPIKEGYYNYFDMTTPVMSDSLVVAVPPGAPYTPIEKFFLPFDLETWICFTIVFVAAFSVTVCIKLSRSRSLRLLVIGEGVSTPGLNIFGIFMGIGMMRVPHRIVSRFLLMKFILFSLIMRTAYQGKYFEFMTTDIHKKEIQTLEELIEKNFTLFVGSHQQLSKSRDLPYLRDVKRLPYIEYEPAEADKVIHDIQDASFKGCLLDLKTNLEYCENDTIAFHLLEKKVMTFNFAFTFRRNSFLSSIFRTKVEQLLTGGLYDEWSRLFIHRDRRVDRKQFKPYDTVLTLQHLSIGFYIWLLMCLLSTCAFVGELLTYWGPKVSRMLFFHYILSSFYKMQISMH